MTNRTKPQVHCQWHPLKEVWVGSTYSPNYYRDIKNSKIRDFLQKIAQETQEDLDNLARICEQYGATVRRPKLDPNESMMDLIQGQVPFNATNRPPMQPRDAQLIVKDQFVLGDRDHKSFVHLALDTIDNDHLVNCFALEPTDPMYINPQTVPPMQGAGGAVILKYGRDIFVSSDGCYEFVPGFAAAAFGEGYRIHPLKVDSHADAKISIINPNLMIAAHMVDDYFKDWKGTKVVLDGNIWQKLVAFDAVATRYKGKYWSPEAENNPEICNWVDDYMAAWLNYSSVTFFDLNLLSLDEKTIVVASYNKDIYDAAEKQGIEVIHAPLRHRFFWDGGVHCCTLDILREGALEDYNLLCQ
jgi:N-dimethylarginine dimethylaminohydrolase